MKSNYNIYGIFEKAVSNNPDSTAIEQVDGGKITFGELAGKAGMAAARLSGLGVKDGTKVFFLMTMSIDFYVILLALVKLGAVVVIVDPWMEGKKIEKTISAIAPEYFIGTLKPFLYFSLFRSFREISNKVLASSLVKEKGVPGVAGTAAAGAGYNKPALITFTTGSTGVPRGIIRTHGMLYEQYNILNRLQKYGKGDTDLQPFPVFLLANLGRSASSIIPWGKKQDVEAVDIRRVFDILGREKANILTASPAFLVRLMKEADRRGSGGLNLIKKVFCGGGAVTKKLVENCLKYFCRAEITAVYGSTEAEPICEIAGKELLKAFNERNTAGTCVGKPVREVRIKFETKKYAGILRMQPGEILVAGPHVCRSYFDVEKKRIADKPRDNKGVVWHNTGDIGYKDRRGRIWFCGRVNNLIKSGRKKLPAEAVELEILSRIGIRPVLLEVADVNVLVVEKKDMRAVKTEMNKIRQIIRKHGADFNETRYVGKIPKDPSHRTKIDYSKLRTLVERGSK